MNSISFRFTFKLYKLLIIYLTFWFHSQIILELNDWLLFQLRTLINWIWNLIFNLRVDFSWGTDFWPLNQIIACTIDILNLLWLTHSRCLLLCNSWCVVLRFSNLFLWLLTRNIKRCGCLKRAAWFSRQFNSTQISWWQSFFFHCDRVETDASFLWYGLFWDLWHGSCLWFLINLLLVDQWWLVVRSHIWNFTS